MTGRVGRHYLGSAATRAEGTDRNMEPDREDRSAGPACLRETRLRETRLRDEWRRRSLATGWRMPDDWESEAVGEVLAACRNRALARGDAGLAAVGATALAAACAGLGRSRARAGVGIAETIDDLVALFAVLAGSGGESAGALAGSGGERAGAPAGGEEERAGVLSEGQHGDPALRFVGAIAEGWAEESVSQFARSGCEDPLSGMATLPYLRTRLAEVYREAEQRGTSPAETHRLLVVGLPRRPDPWRRLVLPILVGRDLRAAFPGGETLALAKPGPAIALVPARRDLPLRYARLRRNIQAAFGTQICMTPLPGRLTEALRLVDELAG